MASNAGFWRLNNTLFKCLFCWCVHAIHTEFSVCTFAFLFNALFSSCSACSHSSVLCLACVVRKWISLCYNSLHLIITLCLFCNDRPVRSMYMYHRRDSVHFNLYLFFLCCFGFRNFCMAMTPLNVSKQESGSWNKVTKFILKEVCRVCSKHITFMICFL
jgi:hypothetical protein